jgi:AcrR family transcriptional regulator
MPEKAPREAVSRRSRPAKAPLSQDAVVTTGLELLSRHGLPGLSLRKVATALDTGPASLYVYVSNLDELRSLVLDRALGDVARSGGGHWRSRVKDILRSYAEVLMGRPGLAELALTTMATGPNALRVIESLLAALIEGGMDPGAAAWGVDLMQLQVTGIAAEQSARTGQEDALGPMARATAAASPQDFPHIHALHEELLSGSGRSRFEWALDALIEGIARTPRPTS